MGILYLENQLPVRSTGATLLNVIMISYITQFIYIKPTQTKDIQNVIFRTTRVTRLCLVTPTLFSYIMFCTLEQFSHIVFRKNLEFFLCVCYFLMVSSSSLSLQSSFRSKWYSQPYGPLSLSYIRIYFR